mgnify:FL=1
MENKPTFCTRFMQPSAAEFSARAEGEELYIEGYFAVFGAKYWLWEEAYETVDRGAFTDQTKEDVRALCNHDTTLVLGRAPAGA